MKIVGYIAKKTIDDIQLKEDSTVENFRKFFIPARMIEVFDKRMEDDDVEVLLEILS